MTKKHPYLLLIILIIIPLISAKPLLIAHRGGRYWEGNNFSYISESIEQGADIIELDIRMENNNYIVKHSIFSKQQGLLSDALLKIQNKTIYLDIKDNDIDPNQLIDYVRKTLNNQIIIGSFNKKILEKIEKNESIIINYHCFSFFCSIKIAKNINADWINPVSFLITKNKIKEIQNKGFKFVPAGTENYKKQLKYVMSGAYAISTYKIKDFKKVLARVKNKNETN